MIKRVEGVVEADIDGERVLLAPASLGYFGLNAVGARVWDLVGQEGTSVTELISQLTSEFDVDLTTCEADVQTFLRAATQAGAIQVEG